MIHILQLQIMLIACLACFVTVLPGVFLVLQNNALMSDAISHAILPGIVIMFLLIKNLNSPLLLVGAALAGLFSVLLTQLLIQSKRTKKDAAIGLVFPLFFSIGVVLISLYARNVHIDADMVLLGELAFAPFNRCVLFGYDLGPMAFWALGIIGLITIAIIALFFKTFVLVSFDQEYARVIGFSSSLLFYLLMTITSIVAVGAFDIVGSMVTIALMIVPPATALLLCYRVYPLVLTSLSIACFSCLSGYVIAHLSDISIAGSIAVANGVLFMIIFIVAPQRGLLAYLHQRKIQKNRWAHAIVRSALSDKTLSIDMVAKNLNWPLSYTHTIITEIQNNGELIRSGDLIRLSSRKST